MTLRLKTHEEQERDLRKAAQMLVDKAREMFGEDNLIAQASFEEIVEHLRKKLFDAKH